MVILATDLEAPAVMQTDQSHLVALPGAVRIVPLTLIPAPLASLQEVASVPSSGSPVGRLEYVPLGAGVPLVARLEDSTLARSASAAA